jgi:uncharacterized protein (TIGR03437 family)
MIPRPLLVIAFCVVTLPCSLRAQVPNASLLQIEIENHRLYQFDVDPSKFAKSSANLATALSASPFQSYMGIGDIVSINGTPVKGTVFEKLMFTVSSTTQTAGQSIADVARNGIYEWNFEIMNTNGTSLGRILVQGMAGGPPPPGAPSSIAHANYMVVGGTGVFLGVRGGYFQNNPDASVPIPLTSVAEDPSLRRVFGGGKAHATLYLISQSTPRVWMTENGPAVVHSDNSPVTASNPATVGELLSLYATGLGPTQPGIEPGKTFPANGSAAVVAPISVSVNGVPAEVLGAFGYPGVADGYKVNFRLPSGVPAGTQTVQFSAAWMAGPEVRIPIQ